MLLTMLLPPQRVQERGGHVRELLNQSCSNWLVIEARIRPITRHVNLIAKCEYLIKSASIKSRVTSSEIDRRSFWFF